MVRKILLGMCVLTLGAAAFAWWQYRSLDAWAGTARPVAEEQVVHIPPRTGPRAISALLARAGAVDDGDRFYWSLRLRRKAAGRLRAGDYVFRPREPQTPDDIVDRLLKGEILSVKVTVPEGLRLDEQAPLFAAAGVGDPAEYVRLARDPAFARSLGIQAGSLEGYLFPDTYLVPQNATTEQILRLMVERYRRAWNEAAMQRLPGIDLDEHQAVTLASIIEKETGQPDERPRISCVFHNRLRRRMKLQTDPTVIYSVLMRTGSFDGNLRRVDLDTAHPYNTYSVAGLPPGPIASAGTEALIAALSPLECDDLFFVSKNDGSHVFCPTLACHEENVRRWQIEFFRQKRAQKRAESSRP